MSEVWYYIAKWGYLVAFMAWNEMLLHAKRGGGTLRFIITMYISSAKIWTVSLT